MPLPIPEFRICLRFAFAAAFGVAIFGQNPAAGAQDLEITLTPHGSAAKERPLPINAMPRVTVTLRNTGSKPTGALSLFARHEGLSPATAQGWRIEGGNPVTDVGRIAAGERVERTLRLRVDRAPLSAEKKKLRVEARSGGEVIATAETELAVADCVGAYRGQLEALRSKLSQPIRDAAEETRKSDPALPMSRSFSATGARSGELAAAERLAAVFAARRGADPEMATEWFRFMIQRFGSELNNYSGQAPNPGLCASNYYQIAGYRQGLLPVTKRIDTVRTAASSALTAAREAANGEANESISELVQRLVKESGVASNGDMQYPLAALAAARAGLNGDKRLDPEMTRKFSLAETAAWLNEADRRGQALLQAIEGALAKIAAAQKDTCVCAF